MAFPRPARAPLDDETLAQIYEANYGRVTRYIAARTGDRDLAEDMAGEVFLRAVESLGNFRARGIPFEAWLFRVAHNLVVDHYRKNARRQHVPLDEAASLSASDDPVGGLEHRLDVETVYQAMQWLNPAQQEVVTLRFLAELSSEEAGVIMGRTSGAVRELQRTAIKALRRILTPQAAEAEANVQREHRA